MNVFHHFLIHSRFQREFLFESKESDISLEGANYSFKQEQNELQKETQVRLATRTER